MSCEAKDAELLHYKLIINQKLFGIFDDANILCVKDLYFNIDKDIYEKYSEICKIYSGEPNDCKKCWTKFITEDLISIEENKLEIVFKNECECEGSCPICHIGEISDHKCNRCNTKFCEKCHGILGVGEPAWKNINGVSVCNCKKTK